jgi:hypothetical protein
MNFVSSHRNHENRRYEGSPPQGLSEPRQGSSVFFFDSAVIDPPRGRPVRGGGNFIIGVMGASAPILLSLKNSIFIGNAYERAFTPKP